MKILSADQMRQLDQYTIENEPISSLKLMERAAGACADWILEHFPGRSSFAVICGQGNNGGDGLVVARLLARADRNVVVWICDIGSPSPDFSANLDRLKKETDVVTNHLEKGDLPRDIPDDGIIIDAIFGYGLNRPVEGEWADLISHINSLSYLVVSIDMPSGLFADKPTDTPAIQAGFTLSFELPKRSFCIPENQHNVGEWVILPIGLDKGYLASLDTPYQTIEEGHIRKMLHRRNKFDHKGIYGHALLIAGSYGSMGAAVLAARAALRSGLGLLTVHVPRHATHILQIAVPEALVEADSHDLSFSGLDTFDRYEAIGVGCGIGTQGSTLGGMNDLLKNAKAPLVIDADGLNALAAEPELLDLVPPNSILTPHFKEFSRVFGESENHFERLDLLRSSCQQYKLIIVLKGAHTAIGLPDGKVWFNTTGNPAMATAGSGDVLTGILTGLRAQGYAPDETAMIGVYIHGLAGDLAARHLAPESVIASDITDHLSPAFMKFKRDD